MRRAVTSAFAAIVAIPFLVVASIGIASPAGADPTQCEPNTSWLKVTISTKPWTLTHVDRYGVAPGTTISDTWTAERSRTLTAGVTKYGEGSVSAGGVLAKAEAKAGVSLANNKTTTVKTTVSQNVTFDSASKKRVYALFRGNRHWTGGFEKWVCSSDGKTKRRVAYGTWRTFSAKAQETTLCKRGSEWVGSSYPAGSLDRIACDAIK